MSYVVIKAFKDLTDNNYRYEEGETFPRSGITPSKSRIKELSTTANKRGIPLIKEVEAQEGATEDEPKPTPKQRKPRTKKNAE